MSAYSVHTGLFGPPAEARSGNPENPAVPLSVLSSDEGAYDLLAPGGRGSGVRVSPRRALAYAAVWRAVSLISGKLSVLPLKVIKDRAGRRSVDDNHPAMTLLAGAPNPWMTPLVFKRTLTAHALTRGNGYAYVVRDADAVPTELLPLAPTLTTPVRANGQLWYVTEVPSTDGGPGEYRRLKAEDVLHVKGLSDDGLAGYDVFTLLAETFGKAVAVRDYGAKFFKNGSRPSIALEFPEGMKDEAVNKIVAKWTEMSAGLENAHKVGVLRTGVKVNTYSSSARDSQMVENIQFDAVDVANIFGLPPRKLGLDRGGGYNSLFEENQSIYDDVLEPWCVTWEEECDAKLLTEVQKSRRSHRVKFQRNAVMRANPGQRADFYSKMVQGGIYSRDECREFEDLDPIPDGKGAVFLVPSNMKAAGTEDDPIPLTKAPDDTTPATED